MKRRISTSTLLGNEKTMEDAPIVIGAFGTVTQGTGGLGSLRTSGDHPNYRIVENGQNTEMSPGDLRRLAVT